MDKIIGQHGDVLFKVCDTIPITAKKVKWHKGFVLEKGEGSNIHTIETECDIYIDETNNRMYLKETVAPIEIDHIEHKTKVVTSPTKIVYRDIEQEFDYESMEARKTED